MTAGLPVGTVLLLIFTGIGYTGSEIGGSLVVSRLDRLEGGQLLEWAERLGGIRLANGAGDRLALLVLSYSLGTRHQMPTSIANAVQRARIQDRGVECLALLSALGYGGVNIARIGLTAEVVLTSLAAFTTIITAGTGYLVITRRGAELRRSSLPRILNVADPIAQRARVLQGSLYAPTTIGDFLIWCGVVGRPLIRTGLMLPLGLAAKFLPQSAKGVVMGFVGVDVLSDIQEAFIGAELLSEGVPPEYVEDVAEKKTLKYKMFWSIIYSLTPFFIGLIPYVVCHFVYSLANHVPTAAVVLGFAAYEGVLLLVIGCNFERIDRCVGGVLSKCKGVCSKDEDHAMTAQIIAGRVAPPPASVGARPAVGTTTVTVDLDGSLGSSRRTNMNGLDVGMGRRSSALDIPDHAQPPLRSASTATTLATEDDGNAAVRVPIGIGAALDAAGITAVLGALQMRNIGTTRQGRIVSVLEPGQSSDQLNIQQAIDLDKSDKLIFVVDPVDKKEFYLHLNDVVRGRSAAGIQINLDGVDIRFDRHHGLQLNEEAFGRALQELELNFVGATAQGRGVYFIVPNQTSDDRYIRRLLQLERTGERHCFIGDAKNERSVYCSVFEVFGTNIPDANAIRSRINNADHVFDRKIHQAQHPISSATASALTPSADDDGSMMQRTRSVHFADETGISSPQRLDRYKPSAISQRDEEEERGGFYSTAPFATAAVRRRVVELDDDEMVVRPCTSNDESTRRREPYHVKGNILLAVGGDDVDVSQLGNGFGVGMTCPFDTEPSRPPTRAQRFGRAISSTVLSMASGISGWFSRKKVTTTTVEEEMTSSAPAVVTVVTNTVQASAVADDSSTDEEKEESRGSGDDSGGANSDSDVLNNDEHDSSGTRKEIEWYDDDRQAINGNGIDMGVFQENKPKDWSFELVELQSKLPKNLNKEHKTAREIMAKILKEIEERGVVKSLHFEEEESDDDTQDEKTAVQKMLEEVNNLSLRIMPKKYDIPKDIQIVPPQIIKFSSWLPSMPSMPLGGDISSYFYQSSASFFVQPIHDVKEKFTQVRYESFLPIIFSMFSSSITSHMPGAFGDAHAVGAIIV